MQDCYTSADPYHPDLLTDFSTWRDDPTLALSK